MAGMQTTQVLALGACAFAGQAFLQSSQGKVDVISPALRGAAQPQQSTSIHLNAQTATATAVASMAVAGAFIGAKPKSRTSAVIRNFNKESQIGAQAPLGFWDPAGFTKDEASFKDLRAKEIKHGRLAMMGALGMLGQSLVQVPGMEGVPKDVTACLVGNGQTGFLAILAVIAGLEAAVFVQDPNKEPGNFGNPLPWFDDYSDEMRSKELNNGRIAMFSAIGIIAAGLYTGAPAAAQLGL